MVFRRFYYIAGSLTILALYCLFAYSLLNGVVYFLSGLIVILAFVLYYWFDCYKVAGTTLSRYSCLMKRGEYGINDIYAIEAVSVTRRYASNVVTGQEHAIGHYQVLFSDDTEIRLDVNYKSKGVSLGRYLQERSKARMSYKEEVQVFRDASDSYDRNESL